MQSNGIIFNYPNLFGIFSTIMETYLDRIIKITQIESVTIGALERKIGASKGVLSRAIQKARLHEYNKDDWQIEYYIQNPVTNRLERKRIRVNKILKQYKNRRDARAHIDNIIFSINSKLFSGWNPFFEGEDAQKNGRGVLVRTHRPYMRVVSFTYLGFNLITTHSFFSLRTGFLSSISHNRHSYFVFQYHASFARRMNGSGSFVMNAGIIARLLSSLG